MSDYGPDVQTSPIPLTSATDTQTSVPAPHEDSTPAPINVPSQYVQTGGSWQYHGAYPPAGSYPGAPAGWVFRPNPTPQAESHRAVLEALLGFGGHPVTSAATSPHDLAAQLLGAAGYSQVGAPPQIVEHSKIYTQPNGSVGMEWDPKDFDQSRWGGSAPTRQAYFEILPGNDTRGMGQKFQAQQAQNDRARAIYQQYGGHLPEPMATLLWQLGTLDPATGQTIPGWPGMEIGGPEPVIGPQAQAGIGY